MQVPGRTTLILIEGKGRLGSDRDEVAVDLDEPEEHEPDRNVP